MATMAFSSPAPSAATKASDRISDGNDRKMSVIRISTVSNQPPKYPASVPTASPIGPTMTATSAMIVSVIREP